uniref:Beta-xylanase n=1 Tax=uncultured bacterium contig00151 TaxID=1181590 RepID=A0A806KL63_9BACT|nr:glycosyl hydrolase family 10 [uncultured bacterium contig00151]
MKKLLIVLFITVLAVAVFISWNGLSIPSATDAQELVSYNGKTGVLQIKPVSGDYGWALLFFDLAPYVGQTITIEISMQAWLEAPGTVLWQINSPSYPIIAGSMTPLAAGQWHDVRGSGQIKVEGGNVLYLSNNQSGSAQRYFADLAIKINDRTVEVPGADANIPALHTKWPFKTGAAVPGESLLSSSPQHGLLRHFNVLVAENDMKPESIMPRPWTPAGAYRWTAADRLVNYAEANNTAVRGHVLFWHEQTPAAYFQGGGRNGRAAIDELYARMENHVKTVFEKYGGRIGWWDVCNEVVGDNGSPRPNSPYTQIMTDAGKSGMDRYEYVLKAFQWARRYADANGGQNVKLYLTDYGIENRGGKQTEFLRLLDYLIANNAPIDGVGIQGHINYEGPDARDFSSAIDSITAKQRGGKNLTVQVCELDMSLFRGNEASRTTLSDRDLNTRLRQQTARYRELFDMFEQKYNQGKLDMVLVWGLADGHSWLNYFPVRGRTDYPLLFDRNYQPKQAYQELLRGR